MEKPEIIKELEKRIGKELKQYRKVMGYRNGYAKDESGNITGLNLSAVKLFAGHI